MNLLLRFLIALVLLFGLNVRPSMAELSEGQIKSAYVLNFVKFAEWPAGAGVADKVMLCVVGSNVLGGALSELDGRKAGGRELRVVQYASENLLAGHPNADSELGSCHVVFIGESEQRRFVPIIKALGDSPALTISDIEDFAEKGGCIGLRYRENKIVFEVNLTSIQKSKLRLPGQLLNLASYVFGR
jgi:hypothetical protein